MENFYIVEAEDNPSIFCDEEEGLIEIEGRSLPENAEAFYNPLIEWVKKYIENPKPETTISLGFDYLNSSSSKKILEILMLLKKILPEHKLKILWKYRSYDEDMYEEGIDFEKMTKLDFTFNIT